MKKVIIEGPKYVVRSDDLIMDNFYGTERVDKIILNFKNSIRENKIQTLDLITKIRVENIFDYDYAFTIKNVPPEKELKYKVVAGELFFPDDMEEYYGMAYDMLSREKKEREIFSKGKIRTWWNKKILKNEESYHWQIKIDRVKEAPWMDGPKEVPEVQAHLHVFYMD